MGLGSEVACCCGWPLAAVALLGTYLLRALRMRAEWRHVRKAGVLHCLQMTLHHNAALLLMPMRSGEMGYVWMVRRHWGVHWTEAARSLLWLRLQDLVVLAAFGLVLLPPWPLWIGVALLAPYALSVLAARRLLRWIGRRVPKLQGLAEALLARDDLAGWLYSLGNWSLKLAVLGSLYALLAGVDPLSALRAALGGEMGSIIPLQPPASLGTYEAGVWAALRVHGDVAPATVGAALAIHVFALLQALLAAALFAILPPPRIQTLEDDAPDGIQTS